MKKKPAMATVQDDRTIKTTNLQFHEIANIFPMMDESRFMELVEDVRENGLVDAIDSYEGKILDGRNRYRACLIAGVTPRIYEYNGDDPLGYVLSKNMHRRHLDDSQRAMVGANIANLPRGAQPGNKLAAKQKDAKNESVNLPIRFAVADAAEAVNVSPSLIGHARRVKESGHDCLHQAVVDGALPVSTAARFTRIVTDPEKQKHLFDTQGVAGIKDIVSADRHRKKASEVVPSTDGVDGGEPGKPTGSSIQFAKFAICQLERIADWDSHKFEAVKLVEDWIAKKREEWKNVS